MKDHVYRFWGPFAAVALLILVAGSSSYSLQATGVPEHGFLYTPVDATNITDPNISKVVIITAVTTKTDGTLRVKYKESGTTVDIPMSAGVRRSMVLKQIYSTGTTSQIVTDGVTCEY